MTDSARADAVAAARLRHDVGNPNADCRLCRSRFPCDAATLAGEIELLREENRQLHHALDSLPERGEMARLREVLEAARVLIRNREAWEGSLAFRDPVAADDADDAYPAVFDALCHAVAAFDTPPASAAGGAEGR